jgi:4-amino-4-deoxy-L-arabinose transferase-like glycosyltransferase
MGAGDTMAEEVASRGDADVGAAGQGVASAISPRAFTLALGGLVLVGALARVLFAVHWSFGRPLHGDPLSYQQIAADLAHGKGYVAHFLGKGPLVPTAEHPPVFSGVLAVLDLVGLQSPDAHRIALSLIGSGGVLAMGLLGRRVAGPAVGLVAAVIAALSPLWVQQSGFVMSESVYLVVIPTMLLFALRCIDRPNRWDFFALGALIGIATLTRGEAVDFVVLLGGVVVLVAAHRWKDRLMVGLLVAAGILLFVVPWVIRNDVSMGAPLLSTNGGDTLAGSYCAETFSPKLPTYGGFSDDCQFGDAAIYLKYGQPPNHQRHWNERTLTDAISGAGTRFARTHLSDLPGVVLAREGRVWGVYSPGTQLDFDVAEDGNGARGPKQAGQILNYALLPLAVAGGVVTLRRSRRRFAVLVVPIVVVALNAAVFYGSTRIRTAAEPTMALFAAVALVALVDRLRRSRSRVDVATDT